MSARKIVVYDTTLRDGAQGPDVSFSARDKERIARALDWLGFDYVEAGFPGSNPKDAELFARLGAKPLTHARLSAFGATRRAGGTCEDDTNLAALAASNAPVWTLVGKSDVWQVAKVLGTTTNENLAMVEESVAYGVGQGRPAGGVAVAFQRAVADGGGDRQPCAAGAAAFRRSWRVRPQGWSARRGGAQAQGRLPAHRPHAGGQRSTRARVRAVRPGQHSRQGARVRARAGPRRSADTRARQPPQGARASGLRL